MKRYIAIAVLLVAASPPPKPDLAGLAWMSGRWVEEKDGRWTEENWSAPRGGVMLGTGLSGTGGTADDYEFMRIAAGPNGLAFWGSPKGKPAVAFRLVSAERNAVVFENPKHDYPTRIAYRLDGAILTATISGPGGSRPMRWRYRRR